MAIAVVQRCWRSRSCPYSYFAALIRDYEMLIARGGSLRKSETWARRIARRMKKEEEVIIVFEDNSRWHVWVGEVEDVERLLWLMARSRSIERTHVEALISAIEFAAGKRLKPSSVKRLLSVIQTFSTI